MQHYFNICSSFKVCFQGFFKFCQKCSNGIAHSFKVEFNESYRGNISLVFYVFSRNYFISIDSNLSKNFISRFFAEFYFKPTYFNSILYNFDSIMVFKLCQEVKN